MEPPKGYDYFVVAVTDVHLGYVKKVDPREFEDFLNQFVKNNTIENFIVMGDFLDLWRSDNKRLLKTLCRQDRTLGILSDRKKNDGIGTIYYVVGNHDFSVRKRIEGCKKLQQNLFEFVGPECDNADPWLARQCGGRTYRFIHGHQLRECRIVPLYSAVCRHFCNLGEDAGLALSRVWDHIACLLTLLVILLNLVLLPVGLLWVAAIDAALLLVYWSFLLWQKHRIKHRGKVDQELLLVEKLPSRLLRKYLDGLPEPPVKRGERPLPDFTREEIFHYPPETKVFELSDKDRDDVREKYRKLKQQEAIPDISENDLERILGGKITTAPTAPNERPGDYIVEGHTHLPMTGVNAGVHRLNLGCWYEDACHYYLTIDRQGNCEVFQWLTKQDWKQIPETTSQPIWVTRSRKVL